MPRRSSVNAFCATPPPRNQDIQMFGHLESNSMKYSDDTRGPIQVESIPNREQPQVCAHVSVRALVQLKSQGAPTLLARPPYCGSTCGAQTVPHELPRNACGVLAPTRLVKDGKSRKKGTLRARTGGPVGIPGVGSLSAPAPLALARKPINDIAMAPDPRGEAASRRRPLSPIGPPTVAYASPAFADPPRRGSCWSLRPPDTSTPFLRHRWGGNILTPRPGRRCKA